ncbi:MAG: GFA family protein [bacterium]|nr:GFA family protein [bacterium]
MVERPHVPVTGGCLCGAIRYESTEAPELVGFCHCRMCQKATGGLFLIFADFEADAFKFTRGEPRYYRSSEIATRGFCPDCGTPVTFQYDGDAGPAVGVGTLDHPEDWPPTWEHSGIESKVPWYEISDDLPQTTTEESGFLKDARDRKASAAPTSSRANERSE